MQDHGGDSLLGPTQIPRTKDESDDPASVESIEDKWVSSQTQLAECLFLTMCMYLFVGMCMCLYVGICLCVGMCMCLCVDMCLYVVMCMYLCVGMCMCVCVCTCVCVWVWVCACMFVCDYVHVNAGANGGQERTSGFLDLETQIAVGHPTGPQ